MSIEGKWVDTDMCMGLDIQKGFEYGEIKQQVAESGLQPGLGVIMVGNRPDAAVYVMINIG